MRLAASYFEGWVRMLKISIIDDQRRRRMIVEGALIAPWTDELLNARKEAETSLNGRELVVDVRGLTSISPAGADLLFHLIRGNIRLQCGVYLQELLRQLARDAEQHPLDGDSPLNCADS